MLKAKNLGNGNYQIDGLILTREQANQIWQLMEKEYVLDDIEKRMNEHKEDFGIEENQKVDLGTLPVDLVENMYDDFQDVYYGIEDDRMTPAFDYIRDRYANEVHKELDRQADAERRLAENEYEMENSR